VAEKATIYKASIQLADLDRHYYGDFNLTIALHPSETLERMLVRILAFCHRAAENLSFTRGLSTQEEPDLWLKHADGRILEWIEVGQPAPERLKKASGQAEQVKVFAYGRGLDIWWKANAEAIGRLPKVTIAYFDAGELQGACACLTKTMDLAVSITEGITYLSSKVDGRELNVTLQLKSMNDLA